MHLRPLHTDLLSVLFILLLAVGLEEGFQVVELLLRGLVKR